MKEIDMKKFILGIGILSVCLIACMSCTDSDKKNVQPESIESKTEREYVLETESVTRESESQEDSLSETEADSVKETEKQISEKENKKELANKSETNVQKPANNSSSGNSNTTKPVETQKPEETIKPVVPETQKPVETTKPVEPQKPAETTKPVEPQKPAETTKPVVPETQAHTHNWVAVIEQQDQGWYETNYEMVEYSICSTCGSNITGFAAQHLIETMHGGYYSSWEQVATGQTWVPNIVEVIVGYTCSCGASK